MGKTFRFKQKTHEQAEKELESKDWKHDKKKLKNSPRSPSSKQIHGHFSKMHIWPVTDTKQKGGRKI